MYAGSRVTDAVDYFKRRGELRGAVRLVRLREPERFRWRLAVGALTATAGRLRGHDRMRVEEPIREMVVEGIEDGELRREIVLDARRRGVDLDRGEVLPHRSVGDLRRASFLTGTDLSLIHRYVPLADDFFAPVDTGGVVIVGRAIASVYRKRAQQLWLRLPDPDGPQPYRLHERFMAERADRESHLAERWGAFARSVVTD